MRRVLVAYFAFSSVEWAVWIVVLVYARGEGTAATVGLVAVAQLIPAALLAPYLASVVDRLPRTTAPLVAYTTVALSLGLTASAMLSAAPFVVVIGLAVATNVVIGLARPAHHGLIPFLASGPAELVAANVVTSAAEGMGLFLGPAVVGAIMALASTGMALLVCVAFIGGAVLLTAGLSRIRVPIATQGSHVEAGIAAGFRALRRSGTAGLPLVVGGVQSFLEGAVDVLIVLLALDVLALGEGGPGYLNSLLGIGALAGGLVSSLLVGRLHLAPPLAISGLLTGGAMILMGLFPAGALLLAVAGIGYSVTGVASRTMLQRLSPMAAMGRMFGFLEAITLVGLAAGALVAPLVAEWAGIEAAFAFFGGVMPVFFAIVWRRLRRADAAASAPSGVVHVLQRAQVVAGLAPDALEAMARGAYTSVVATGEEIVAEDTAGHEMFVIEGGEVEVSRGGEKVAMLGPGDIFGEIALMDGASRIATVTAREPTSLVVVTGEGFSAALSTDPDARRALEALVAARRTQTLGEEA